eukprot:RCo043256
MSGRPFRSTAELERQQKQFWDAYEGPVSIPLALDTFSRAVPAMPDVKVLDYGCGFGRTLQQLRSMGYPEKGLHGIDLSEAMVLKARRTLPRADLRVKKGRRLPYESGTFDAVVLVGVLRCCASNVEQVRLVEELRRVLRPTGVLYVVDFLISEDDDLILCYNSFQEGACEGEVDLPYGVFAVPGTGLLLRHHDPAWVETLLAGPAP